MISIGTLFKLARERHGVSQKQLLKGIEGVSQPNYSDFENNGRRISDEKLIKMAEILNLNSSAVIKIAAVWDQPEAASLLIRQYFPEYFNSLELAPAELPKTLVPFPCKGTVAASGLCYTEEPPETYYFQFADPRVYDTNMFCLKIQGDSMAPDYKDGGLLLVRPTTTFKNGKPYIVQTENHETTFKIVEVSPNGTMLIPINKRHKPFSVDSHRIVKLFEIIQYRWEP